MQIVDVHTNMDFTTIQLHTNMSIDLHTYIYMRIYVTYANRANLLRTCTRCRSTVVLEKVGPYKLHGFSLNKNNNK